MRPAIRHESNVTKSKLQLDLVSKMASNLSKNLLRKKSVLTFINLQKFIFCPPQHKDWVAEWLRRWTANPMCSARVGSNPISVEIFLHVSILSRNFFVIYFSFKFIFPLLVQNTKEWTGIRFILILVQFLEIFF